jgi:hypothetical protein
MLPQESQLLGAKQISYNKIGNKLDKYKKVHK